MVKTRGLLAPLLCAILALPPASHSIESNSTSYKNARSVQDVSGGRKASASFSIISATGESGVATAHASPNFSLRAGHMTIDLYPGMINGFVATPGAAPGTINLQWIAPGNDAYADNTTSKEYVIKMSSVAANSPALSWGKFIGAASVTPAPPAPAVEGTLQSMTVTGLQEGIVYYFAIAAQESDSLFGPLSAQASAQATGTNGCAVVRNVCQSGCPYNTIQAGVNAIPNPLIGYSCVIVRDSAAYNEKVVIQNFVNNGSSLTVMLDPALSAHPALVPPPGSEAGFAVANTNVNILNIDVRPNAALGYGIKASSSSVMISGVVIEGGTHVSAAAVALSSASLISASSFTALSARGVDLSGAQNSSLRGSFVQSPAAVYAWGGLNLSISSNTIAPLISGTQNSYGLFLAHNSGSALQHNSVYFRSPASAGANTAYALYVQNGSGILIDHNRFSNPAVVTGGHYTGVRMEASAGSQFKFNDVYGAGTALGRAVLLELAGGSSASQIKNNIFVSSFVVSVASASLSVSADSLSGTISDYNNIFAANGAHTEIWGSQSCTFPAGLQVVTCAGQDSNTFAFDPLWHRIAAGAEDFHPHSSAGRYDAGLGIFVADADTSYTIDVADPSESFAKEPSPNGSQANLGSYGNTAEASKSTLYKIVRQPPYRPFGIDLASVLVGTATISWMPVRSFQNGSSFLSSATANGLELTAYRVYRATTMFNASWTLMAVLSTTTFSWTDLASASSYYYCLQSENPFGRSKYSMIRAQSDKAAYVLAPDGWSHLHIPAGVAAVLKGDGVDSTTAYDVDASTQPGDAVKKIVKSVDFRAIKGGMQPTQLKLSGLASLNLRYDVQSGGVIPAAAPVTTPDQMSVYWNNSNRWMQLYGKVDTSRQTMTLNTVYLGSYQLRAVERVQAFSFDTAGISNRLITPNGDGKNDAVVFTFDNPRDSSVTGKILDLKGARVADMSAGPVSNSLMWDGRSQGNVVASGVYIYQLEAEGKILNGTVAVIK